ncbi:uncharacterized protein LOC119360915 [Triticum dicoccoides]|uniref:uncharacterized protein LOC119360915 n=1 Tax=Triticum dicoccoides TaxID=85692 RepID=UPI00188E3667|nr:uncharacterized protein LOC119360915 [Triticum dicoccoides]
MATLQVAHADCLVKEDAMDKPDAMETSHAVRKNQLPMGEGMGYLESKHHLLLSIEFNPLRGFLLLAVKKSKAKHPPSAFIVFMATVEASSPLVPVFSAPNPAGVCSCIEQGSEEEEPPAPVAVLFCSSSSSSDRTRPCVSGIVPASRSPCLHPPPSSSRSASALPRLVCTKPRRPLLDRASACHLRLELPEIAPAASSPLCVPRRRGSISSRAEDARSSCRLTVCRPRWPIQPVAQLQPLPHLIGPRSASSLEPNFR